MKLLLLLRGVPGVGKTTIAEALQSVKGTGEYDDKRVVCISADDYFYNKVGHYLFIPESLGRAHDYCQDVTRAALRNGETQVIIVHNTFCEEYDMAAYYAMANQHNALCSSVIVEGRRYTDHTNEFSGEFLGRSDDCKMDSLHDVPEKTINKMVKELKGSVLI